jgi:hypothetical protein
MFFPCGNTPMLFKIGGGVEVNEAKSSRGEDSVIESSRQFGKDLVVQQR